MGGVEGMKVLFLDVDGVLNRCGKSSQGLESDKISLLKDIVEATHCMIVLSSTWRLLPWSMGRLNKALSAMGMSILDRTPELEQKSIFSYERTPRGQEIKMWLDSHPYADRYVIVDDDSDMLLEQAPWFVRTESYVGLTYELAQEVINKLNS